MPRVLLSSGRGPIECELAVGLYLRFFLARHPDAKVVREERGKTLEVGGKRLTGYRSVLVELSGDGAIQTGAVRWICQSPVRPHHRRKNWFIDVSLLTDDSAPAQLLETDIDWENPDKRCFRIETFRSPGKGGQNVNKVETGVRVTHLPTGIKAESVTARTQLANRKLAFERLRAILAAQTAARDRHVRKEEWANHDRLERGNAFAVFSGLDFLPMDKSSVSVSRS